MNYIKMNPLNHNIIDTIMAKMCKSIWVLTIYKHRQCYQCTYILSASICKIDNHRGTTIKHKYFKKLDTLKEKICRYIRKDIMETRCDKNLEHILNMLKYSKMILEEQALDKEQLSQWFVSQFLEKWGKMTIIEDDALTYCIDPINRNDNRNIFDMAEKEWTYGIHFGIEYEELK